MSISNDEAIELVRRGAELLQQGHAPEARACFERITQTGRANSQIWMLQATASRHMGDAEAEEAAIDQVLVMEPRLIRAHIMKADCRSKHGDSRGALEFYESALLHAGTQQIPDDLHTEMLRVEQVVEQWRSRADADREALLNTQGLVREARSARFQESIDILAGRKQIFFQQPTGYFFPRLAQIQFFEREAFDWVEAVESQTAVIREELYAMLAGHQDGFRPYLHGDPNRARLDDNRLLDSPDWSALFLCENGQENAAMIARCPRTWEAMRAAPMPAMANTPTVMFSLLRPGARIAPHTGMFNTRLICHLPLIVPPGCGFRVGNETREWEEGKLIIFDDTIEHEAWNGSDSDRVVLIFDVWRPELSAKERMEITALFSTPGVA